MGQIRVEKFVIIRPQEFDAGMYESRFILEQEFYFDDIEELNNFEKGLKEFFENYYLDTCYVDTYMRENDILKWRYDSITKNQQL